MNPNVTSTASAKGRTERPNKPSLIARVRLWLAKLVSSVFALLNKVPFLRTLLRSPAAWVLMTFVIGFAAGIAWQSYSSGGRTGGTSSERLKAMSVALSAARQNLDKLSNEMSRLEARGLDAPQRRSAR